MENIILMVKKIIPKGLFRRLQPPYHYLLALLGALIYRFPSRHIKVVVVTGTKGKSTVVELTNAILEEAGFKTAILGTIRFKVGDKSKPNLYKMTTPGRFFVQKFLRQAVTAKCDYTVLEMTSEAARQFRHKFIEFDALVFTNLSPEHIESHGSYEKYVAAKLSIGKALEQSQKKNTVIVVNSDEKEAGKFLALNIPRKLTYSLKEATPYEVKPEGISFTFSGEKITSHLEGLFNIYNCLAAATLAKSQNIGLEIIKRALEKITVIPGRVEHVELDTIDPTRGKQNFTVIVDYAHTPDSLEKLYQAFPNQKKIAILGNTGGGRDTWKRPVMAEIAGRYCDKVILTNEDPYDEDPKKILNEMAAGMKNPRPTADAVSGLGKKPEIILDRREAIAAALRAAAEMSALKPSASTAGTEDSGSRNQHVVVLITGKGTDPFIMGPNGNKMVWSDKKVVQEELEKIKN